MSGFALQPLDAIEITVLMDNVSDMLLTDHGPARRAGMASAPRIDAATIETRRTVDSLQAEHGFSALVKLEAGGRTRTLLFDTGVSPDGMTQNMRRLGIDPRDVEILVLSHGHFDHTTGLDGFVRAVGRPNLPVMIHPEFWTRRRIAFPGRDPFELPTTSKPSLEGAGFQIVEERRPSFLLDGALLVTGEVDRTTDFETGFPIHQAERAGAWEPDPLILDDQALVANVRGRGLVVLSGCGHSGMVNILRYATKLTGTPKVHAVIGGFHLSGPVFEPVIAPTVEGLAAFEPDVIVPSHCTGWRASHALAARYPDAFIQTSVGTRFELRAPEGDA